MSAVSGRVSVKKYGMVIAAASFLVRRIPSGLRGLLWDMSRPFGGRFALLLRYALLRADSPEVGKNVYIGRNVTLLNRRGLRIGSNVSIHENCYIDAVGSCIIGNDVSIAHASSILTFNHGWDDISLPIKYNPTILNEVKIADDVWIGAGARILGGVSIGRRSVVAAGAVVNINIEEYSVCGGVPAKFLRRLPGYQAS